MEEGGPLNLIYTERSLKQLDDILDYLKPRNERAAAKVFGRIQKTCERLTRHPFSGRPEGPRGSRTISVSRYPYVVMYRVHGGPPSEIEVLGVFHTSLGERKI